jgi:hypothetical protein
MKRREQLLITPIWAQKIEVEEHGELLLVTGRGHVLNPVDVQELTRAEIRRFDLFAQFERYAKTHLTKKQGSTEAGVYEFADATDDEKLAAFVKKHGPVWGEVRSKEFDQKGACTVIVAQDRNRLRREQEVFASAAELLSRVNGNREADPEAISLAMEKLAGLPRLERSLPDDLRLDILVENMLNAETEIDLGGPAVVASAIAFSKKVPRQEKTKSVLSSAHWMLCELFNLYPPRMFPHRGKTVDLPKLASEGIREALYFKLRLDYQARRAIGTCLHCGGQFPVMKRGARACGEACRRALRNQKYWNRHRKTINQYRRKQSAGRK